jgi:hypothetical protein
VFGGGRTGLMGTLANSLLDSGGEGFGVIVERGFGVGIKRPTDFVKTLLGVRGKRVLTRKGVSLREGRSVPDDIVPVLFREAIPRLRKRISCVILYQRFV